MEKMHRFHFLDHLMHSIVYFLLCASFTAMAYQKQLNISLGSSLAPTANSLWLSRSGLYGFGFYRQGKGYSVGVCIAGIPEKTFVWTANRDSPVSMNSTLVFNTKGRLLLKSIQGQDTTDVAKGVSQPASYASMLDSGNFVLYNSSGAIIWQSFDYPTDTILTDQRLLAGQELYSSVSETDHSTGKYRLNMQHDGNLVQYPMDVPKTAPYAYYSSFTFGKGDNVSLNLDSDGHLYLLNSTGFNICNITEGGYPTGGTIYLMRIDWDGIFRLYSHNLRQNSTWSIVWESSADKCDPKGLCGFNSLCVLNDKKPDCRCLPGFASVNKGNQTSGCERNFTVESCINRRGVKHTIQILDNTVWEDSSYSILSLKTKEDCEQTCLGDCNCDAALFYNNGQCRLQRLPLRFGRKELNNAPNTIAFVKVYTSTPSSNISVPSQGKQEIRMDIIVILICLFAALLLVIILATFGVVMYKCNPFRSNKRISSNGRGFCQDIVALSFTYAEVDKITDGFKEKLGRGSSGTVYKGTLTNGKVVAVKKLSKELSTGETEFRTEMNVIGRTHHKNLVRLLGYSSDGPNKLLIYDYMSNGSLADILFTPEKRQPNWVDRMEIACGIARGILYLHEECESQIIHCDIKPQNVLMDENNCAKISDFGLAKLMKPEQTKTFTEIRGTRGYVAPEWFRNLPVSVKADVYSFGVVLLEIICCRRRMDQSLPDNQAILEEWVYQCFEDSELGQVVGHEEVEISELERMIKVGLWCIVEEPSLRPSMKNVLLMLEGTVDIPITLPSPTSFHSSF